MLKILRSVHFSKLTETTGTLKKPSGEIFTVTLEKVQKHPRSRTRLHAHTRGTPFSLILSSSDAAAHEISETCTLQLAGHDPMELFVSRITHSDQGKALLQIVFN
ncbi:MAG: hypothetical protein HQL96_14710 [Magnetococcales bacterium]|nr:hypothetical protein [Magnetococcales bacterium]